MDKDEILNALSRVALSPPNDAVALALDPENACVKELDLWCLAEFKRSGSGNVEIKLADRVKAIDLLLSYAGGGEEGMAALLEALEGGESE